MESVAADAAVGAEPAAELELDYEQAVQALAAQFAEQPPGEHDQRLAQIEQTMAKLADPIDFRRDARFLLMLNELVEQLRSAGSAQMKRVLFQDLLGELRVYVARLNAEPHRRRLTAKEINRTNVKIAQVKREIQLVRYKLNQIGEAELGDDELDSESSAFVHKQPRLQRQLEKLLNKLHDCQQMPQLVTSQTVRRFKFRQSEHPALNRALSEEVNRKLLEHYVVKKQRVEKRIEPDVEDVLEVVRRVNEEQKLRLADVDAYAVRMHRLLYQQLARRRREEIDFMLASHELNQLQSAGPPDLQPDEDEELQRKLKANDEKKCEVNDYLERFAEQRRQEAEAEENDKHADEEPADTEDSESDSEAGSEDSLDTLGSDSELEQEGDVQVDELPPVDTGSDLDPVEETAEDNADTDAPAENGRSKEEKRMLDDDESAKEDGPAAFERLTSTKRARLCSGDEPSTPSYEVVDLCDDGSDAEMSSNSGKAEPDTGMNCGGGGGGGGDDDDVICID